MDHNAFSYPQTSTSSPKLINIKRPNLGPWRGVQTSTARKWASIIVSPSTDYSLDPFVLVALTWMAILLAVCSKDLNARYFAPYIIHGPHPRGSFRLSRSINPRFTFCAEMDHQIGRESEHHFAPDNSVREKHPCDKPISSGCSLIFFSRHVAF